MGRTIQDWCSSINIRKCLLILALAGTIFSTVPVVGQTPRTVRIGVLAKRGNEQCLEQWGATAEYLTKQIPEYSFSIIPLGFGDIQTAVNLQNVEFVLANSSYYVELEVRLGARRIATLNNLHASGATHKVFAGLIFCRADRDDIQVEEDLINKSFMATDQRSLGGWHMAWRELLEHGIDPINDFSDLRFGGTHDAVVYAVRDGEVDAGSVRSDTIERMVLEGKVRLDDFKVLLPHTEKNGEMKFLHSTAHYPEWPFAKSPHTSDGLAEQVALALIQMPSDSPAARAAKCAGWTIPQNYRPVHECLMALNLPPYENYGKVTLLEVLQKYRFWLLGLFVLTTLFILFVVRASRLKAKLEQSNLERTERERLTHAIDQVVETIIITDVKGTIQYANPAFEKISGYSCEEAAGLNPNILKSGEHDDAFYEELWNTILQGGTWSGRILNRKKDGTLYTEEATISPVRDDSGTTVNFVAVKRDITEEIKLEEQLRQAQKMESIGRLAGGVAHDFNNMLGVVIGYTEIAMEQTDLSQSLHANLKEIRTAAERSVKLTAQLLAFARKQTISPQVLDLNQTLAGMLRMLHRLLREDIEIAWRPGADIWMVKVDSSQIDQILINLCVNARDAINDMGKVTIETNNVTIDKSYCAHHTGFVPGAFVMLAVSDDGCGMDKDTLDNIYEPFYSTKEMGRGTGLGLATVYGIVKQNNGFINVYSEPGHGTTFKIFLPRHTADAEPVQKKILKTVVGHCHETILVVEDEQSLLAVTKVMLEHQGYTVLTASKPSEAIRLAKETNCRIHLLLTDVVMPEMNGRDLAKNLLATCPNLKHIFMSGYTANVIAHHGVLDAKVHFIQKPFERVKLADKVREVLDLVE